MLCSCSCSCSFTVCILTDWAEDGETLPPLEQYGLTWDPFTNFYCLDQGTFCYIEVSYLHCVNCVKHRIDEHKWQECLVCIEAFCCCKVSTVILMLCSFCYCMYAEGFSRRWRDTAPFEQCGLTCYFEHLFTCDLDHGTCCNIEMSVLWIFCELSSIE